MGVAGLWDILRPAAKIRSLTELAVTEGFEANPDGIRGFRVGIDASIWFFHANWGKEGENPELRTLFFRCATLMHAPFLPLFVFDGPKRPSFKRGKRIQTTSHKLTTGMKAIIESFGFEWRTAPGEAEAELAYLNRSGVIDAVLSDDVDNFLFGATMVIRNSSSTLSGNRTNPVLNSDGRDDKNHTSVYRLKDITSHPEIGLNRGGLILIGLLSGGDYHQAGLARCGIAIAHGLARCGLGDSLYEAATTLSSGRLSEFLVEWRDELRHELRTNSKGFLGKRYQSLANSVPNDFPDIDILLSYTNPITSDTMGRPILHNKPTWDKEPDLGKLAATCEFYFEWGFKEAIIKRFRTVIWPSAILRILRRAVLRTDQSPLAMHEMICPSTPRKGNTNSSVVTATPSKMITKYFSSMALSDLADSESTDKPLVVKIHSTRQHASTDHMLEYRLEIAPAHLVRLTEAGIKGIRRPDDRDEWADDDDDTDEHDCPVKSKKPLHDSNSHLRVWMPASIVRLAEPRLVQEFEEAQERKRQKNANACKRHQGKSKITANVPIPAGGASAVNLSPISKASRRNIGNDLKPYFVVSKQKSSGSFSKLPRSSETSGEAKTNVGENTLLASTKPQSVKPAKSRPDRTGYLSQYETDSSDTLPSSVSSRQYHPSQSVSEQFVGRHNKSRHVPAVSRSKSPCQRSIIISSESESVERHSKSPRKHGKETSPPLINKEIRSSLAVQKAMRPESPTPSRPASHTKEIASLYSTFTHAALANPTIELSSDSDIEIINKSSSTLPPLLAARSRIQQRIGSKGKRPLSTSSRVPVSSEIIDLT